MNINRLIDTKFLSPKYQEQLCRIAPLYLRTEKLDAHVDFHAFLEEFVKDIPDFSKHIKFVTIANNGKYEPKRKTNVYKNLCLNFIETKPNVIHSFLIVCYWAKINPLRKDIPSYRFADLIYRVYSVMTHKKVEPTFHPRFLEDLDILIKKSSDELFQLAELDKL